MRSDWFRAISVVTPHAIMSLVGLCVQAEALRKEREAAAEALRIEREAAAEEHRIAEHSRAACISNVGGIRRLYVLNPALLQSAPPAW